MDRLDLPRVECPVCGQPVPPGHFCGACGSHLATASSTRGHAFAAQPGEHVLQPSPVSTLFPHLPARHSLPFRVALAAGVALLIVFGFTGLTGPSIAAAALLVPLLYLIYLYDVDVYGDELILVAALTFGLGIVVGAGWSALTSRAITNMLIENAMIGPSAQSTLVFGVAAPLAAQALMLVGALAIFWRRQYDEVLDGFTAGVAGALGFALASTVYNLWPQLSQGLLSSSAGINQTLLLLGRGILVPFILGSMSGLVAGAIWLHRRPMRTLRAYGWTTSLLVVIPFVGVTAIVLGLVNILVTSLPVVVAVYAAVAAVLILSVRVAIHHMLLAESVDVRIGPDMICDHCHHLVPRMAFCDFCGVATRATPKRGARRLFRRFR